jgi:hypothetical protein
MNNSLKIDFSTFITFTNANESKMNTEISKCGRQQVRFVNEVWTMIKNYMGVIPDFPVEIIHVLNNDFPLEKMAQLIYSALDLRRTRIYLRENPFVDYDSDYDSENDRPCEERKFLNPNFMMESGDGSLFNTAQEAIWQKGKKEMKEMLIRMFWNSPNKRELFHYLAWMIIQHRMEKDRIMQLIHSSKTNRDTDATMTGVDQQELGRQAQLSSRLWCELMETRDHYLTILGL